MTEKMSAGELQKQYASGRKNFRNVDLSAVDLKRANLSEANFQQANLQWVSLQAANLRGADFSGADLQRAKLQDANLQKAKLQKANLRGANLQWANLQEADFQEAELPRIDLVSANLTGANLRWADLQGANLQKANLNGADLRIASLCEANLLDADLQKAKLQKANLKKANLSSANLQGANLQGADLQQANLSSANLSSANLQGANLQGANLQHAKLFRVNLQGANLEEALLPSLEEMQGANLRGANLQGMRSPDRENLDSIVLADGVIPDRRDPSAIASNDEKIAVIIPEKSHFVKTSMADTSLEEVAVEENQQIGEESDSASLTDRSQKGEARKEIDGDDREAGKSLEIVTEEIALSIASRRGKLTFRQSLLQAYNYRCAITGCDAEPVLEAASIHIGSGDRAGNVSNGLLLRSDIHTLFDLDLIAIEPNTMTVRVAPAIAHTSYGELNAQPLQLPTDEACRPDRQALQWRCDRCEWIVC